MSILSSLLSFLFQDLILLAVIVVIYRLFLGGKKVGILKVVKVVFCIIFLLVFSGRVFDVMRTALDDNNENTEMQTESEIKWEAKLFEEPATFYKNELALVAAKMSDKAEKKSPKRIKQLYESYGFKDIQACNYSGKGLTSLGGGAFAIGYDDTMTIGGRHTTVLVITARGTTTFGEMIGDKAHGLVLGTKKFLDKRIYTNVYDFKQQIWDKFVEYLDMHSEIKSAENIKFLVTGHSLGGAAANVVGAYLTQKIAALNLNAHCTKDDIYVYTFGAIKVIAGNDENVSEGYENIHNIYNKYDTFGPEGAEGGLEVSSSYAKFGHTELYDIENRKDGVDYRNPEENLGNPVRHLMSNYIEALGALQDNRNVFFEGCFK